MTKSETCASKIDFKRIPQNLIIFIKIVQFYCDLHFYKLALCGYRHSKKNYFYYFIHFRPL